MKEDFSDEDGIRAAELEEEYAELGGWEAESDASSAFTGTWYIYRSFHYTADERYGPETEGKSIFLPRPFSETQTLSFLDEPTNNLDVNCC